MQYERLTVFTFGGWVNYQNWLLTFMFDDNGYKEL